MSPITFLYSLILPSRTFFLFLFCDRSTSLATLPYLATNCWRRQIAVWAWKRNPNYDSLNHWMQLGYDEWNLKRYSISRSGELKVNRKLYGQLMSTRFKWYKNVKFILLPFHCNTSESWNTDGRTMPKHEEDPEAGEEELCRSEAQTLVNWNKNKYSCHI